MKTETQKTEDGSSLDVAAGSHPSFSLREATAGSIFTLSSGAKLTVVRNPTGALISGEYGKITATIALSEEATEILISALILSRPNENAPLPNARLIPFAKTEMSHTARITLWKR